jgi:hypothetical protein
MSESEVRVSLATRLPKSLHRKVRLHCLKSDTTMMEFLVAALREKLAKASHGERPRGKLASFRAQPTARTIRARQNKTAVPKLGQRSPN